MRIEEYEAAKAAGIDEITHGQVILTPASTIQPKRVEWAVEGRIVRGSTSLVAGEQGLGKTLLTAHWAALATIGKLPGCFYGTPISVAISSIEDSREHTLVPRLVAAGADLDRIFFPDVSVEQGQRPLLLPNDIEAWGEAAIEAGCKMLVVDPVMGHLPADVNSHRDQDIRRALAPLAPLGERLDLTCVLIAHLNKSLSRDFFIKVGGSMALTAFVRSGLLVARDPELPPDSLERLLVHGKCNVGPHAPTWRFRVEGREIEVEGEEEPFSTGGIAYLGEDTMTVRDVLGRGEEDDDEKSRLDEAVEFIEDALSTGPMLSKELIKRAKAEGISERTLTRARRKLGIKPRKKLHAGEMVWMLESLEECQEGQEGQENALAPSGHPSTNGQGDHNGANTKTSAPLAPLAPLDEESTEQADTDRVSLTLIKGPSFPDWTVLEEPAPCVVCKTRAVLADPDGQPRHPVCKRASDAP